MTSYSKIVNWTKLIAITGSFQVIVQLLGFVSGILIIRLLPTNEYALYTLANTMLGTMTILADGGISSGVMAQGGKVWTDPIKLGSVLATGLNLRKKFAIGSLIVSIPILIYLLRHNQATWQTTLMIVFALIPAFYAALSDSLLEIVPKLHQTILPLQKNQALVATERLGLSALMLFIFPSAAIAIIASGLPRIYGNLKLRRISNQFIIKNQRPNIEVKKNILAMVRRLLPEAIYFCLSGQISIWLISLFGNIESLAQLGALGRIGLLLTIFNVLISTLIVPRFAKLEENRRLLLGNFLLIMTLLFLLMPLICTFVYKFSDEILWILGENYRNLQIELLITIVTACVSLMTGIAFALYTVRGWAVPPTVLVSVNLSAIIILIFLNEVNTLQGILLYGLELAVVAFVTNAAYCMLKILHLEKKLSL